MTPKTGATSLISPHTYSEVHSAAREDLRVTAHAEEFFEMASGFLASKKELDAVSASMRDAESITSIGSFGSSPEQTWDVDRDGIVSCDDVYEGARVAAFEAMVKSVVAEAGMEPESVIMGPIKSRERAVQKCASDYEGQFARLVDVIRASIVASTEAELVAVTTTILRKANVLRLKNRFQNPPFNGYRDLLMSVRVGTSSSSADDGDVLAGAHGGPTRNTVSEEKDEEEQHVCEVQVHYAPLFALKNKTHVYYQYFRSFFPGNLGAVDARLRVLDLTIGSSRASTLAELCEEIDVSCDEESYKALEKLLGNEMMSEFGVLRVMRARRLLRLAREKGPESDEAVEFGLLLGKAYRKENRLADAEPLFRFVLDAYKHRHGENDARTLQAAYYLSVVLRKSKKYDEAEPLISANLEAQRRVLGDAHEDTLKSMFNKAMLVSSMGNRLEEALGLHESAAAARERTYGPEHQDTLQSRGAMASSLRDLGRFDEAVELLEATLATQRSILGQTHVDTLFSLAILASCFEASGDLVAAKAVLRETRAAHRAKFGLDDARTSATSRQIDEIARRMGDPSRKLCVVDGGSRGTRCYVYQKKGSDDENDTTTTGRLRLERSEPCDELGATLEQLLVEARRDAPEGVHRVAAKVDTWLDSCGVAKSDAVFIGATQGVRQAIKFGRVSDEELAAVETAIAQKRADVYFETVSGEAEGTLEVVATRFAAQYVLGINQQEVGLLSLGGGSTQLVRPHDDATTLLSCGVRTCLPSNGSEPRFFKQTLDQASSAAAAADAWREIVRDALRRPTTTEERLSGTFVGISTTYWVAKDAGVASRILSAAQIKDAIRNRERQLIKDEPDIQAWRAMRNDDDEPDKNAEKLAGAVAVGVILDNFFSDNASFYFERSWTVPPDSGNTFITNWPTGKALQLAGLL